MTFRIGLTTILLLATAHGTAAQSPPPNAAVERVPSTEASKRDIDDVFILVADAIHDRDSETASQNVPESTFDFYEQCRNLALDSSGVDLESHSQAEVLLVLQLRYLQRKAVLSKLTGEDVFKWAVENGMAGKEGFNSFSLTSIQVSGDAAFATIMHKGKHVAGMRFRFIREDNRWKFDLHYISEATEPLFAEIRKESKQSKTEFAIKLLEQSNGKKLPSKAVQGMLR